MRWRIYPSAIRQTLHFFQFHILHVWKILFKGSSGQIRRICACWRSVLHGACKCNAKIGPDKWRPVQQLIFNYMRLFHFSFLEMKKECAKIALVRQERVASRLRKQFATKKQGFDNSGQQYKTKPEAMRRAPESKRKVTELGYWKLVDYN